MISGIKAKKGCILINPTNYLNTVTSNKTASRKSPASFGRETKQIKLRHAEKARAFNFSTFIKKKARLLKGALFIFHT